MIAKCLEVRDSMTFIPVAAVNTAHENEGQRKLLRRAGYSPGGSTVVLIDLNSGNSQNDAYAWGKSRTMTTAHAYIEEHFEQLNDGDVIDVEFILGERPEPKASEA